jgi:hypothetical protein
MRKYKPFLHFEKNSQSPIQYYIAKVLKERGERLALKLPSG